MCFAVPDFRIQRDILSHGLIRVQPDASITMIDRSTLGKFQHSSTQTETLRGGGDSHIVQQHRMLFRNKHENALYSAVMPMLFDCLSLMVEPS